MEKSNNNSHFVHLVHPKSTGLMDANSNSFWSPTTSVEKALDIVSETALFLVHRQLKSRGSMRWCWTGMGLGSQQVRGNEALTSSSSIPEITFLAQRRLGKLSLGSGAPWHGRKRSPEWVVYLGWLEPLSWSSIPTAPSPIPWLGSPNPCWHPLSLHKAA